MANELSVTKTPTETGWVITALWEGSPTIPTSIFAYENTGTTTLGKFYGVVSLSDLARLQIWEGSVIPIFANKFVRHDEVTVEIGADEDPDQVISRLVESVKLF
jgi:hypothetical protein